MAMTHDKKLHAIRLEKDEVNMAMRHIHTALHNHREVCDEKECALHRRLLHLLDTAAGLKHTYEAAEREWS